MRLTLAIGTVALSATLAAAPASPHAGRALTHAELAWLARITFGIDTDTVRSFQQLGRDRFLDAQLAPADADPPALSARIAALASLQRPAEDAVKATRAEQQRINALTSEDDKQAARNTLNQAANQMVYETSERHLMRALMSPAQLREQMTWFWMNHFSVFSGKANVRWEVADYEAQAVRAHALGSFHDLVMATVTAPAMLEYLDNAQSSNGKVNENYARELMELHTLGVSGGASGSAYTQQDVQDLARVLTGVGLNPTSDTPKLRDDLRPQYLRRGLFEFNPARHDAGTKTILSTTIRGHGFAEVEDAVSLLCRQEATARFISHKLATYFVADDPPAGLVDRMSRAFMKTNGSISSVLRVMFLDREFLTASSNHDAPRVKFKDPMQFVVSSLRLAYDGKAATITNYRPIVGWLQQLGQPLYGRVTPDGYALTESAWTSSGQLVRRFEIARAIGSGNAGLFNSDDTPNQPGPNIGFPMLTTRLFYDVIDPTLSAATRTALSRTASQQEWNTVLLASPDWMQR